MKEFFLENLSLFVEIRNYFSISNKKIYDVVKQILYHMNYDDNDNDNLNDIENKETNVDQDKNDNNDPIAQETNVDLFNLNNDSNKYTSNEKNEKKKNFNFIKKKKDENQNNLNSQNVVSNIDEIFSTFEKEDKNADLIGYESKNEIDKNSKKDGNILIDMCSIGNTDLNDIFTNENKNIKTAQLNDLINKLNENTTFNNTNQNKTSDENDQKLNSLKVVNNMNRNNDVNLFYQIPNINTSVNTNTNKIKLCTSDENFNYSKIYGEENKPKDHFDFVKQMMNSKK